MDDWQQGPMEWRRPLVAVVVVVTVGLGAMFVLGTQASRILSTVGASVYTPDGGFGVHGGDQGDATGGTGSEGTGEGDTGGGGGSGAGEPAPAELLDAARPDLLVVKTGEISIRAAAVGAAVQKATDQILALGGYVSGSARSGKGNAASASVVFRVPADQWEAALAAARGAGEDVLGEDTETVDVTGDVVDLSARIRNLQATEAALQSIMTQATAIKDILSVQTELTEVRGQIEELMSKAADLEGRAAYSTLTVLVSTKPAPVVARQQAKFDPGQEADGATARLVQILQRIATTGIWAGIVWLPLLTALGVVGGIGFVIARWVRRAFGGERAGPVAEGDA